MRAVTLITGASAGLGAEFARQCAASGATLVLVARREERLAELRRELGAAAHAYGADLTHAEQPEKLADWLNGNGFAVETLINNAGFGLSSAFARAPRERLTEMIDLNVRSLTDLCRLFVPAMVERRRGFILNVASTAAFQAGPYMAVYYATKAYVLSLTEALHQELKGSGVKVSALCPGPTATEFFDVAEAADSRLARLAMPPDRVVRAGLDGLRRNRAVVIPGLLNKLTAQSNRIAPRALMRRAVARLKA